MIKMRGSVFFIILAIIFIILTSSVLIFNINNSNSPDINTKNKSSILVTGNIVQESPINNTINNTNTTFKSSNPKTHNIEITNFTFSPSELKIKRGDSVIWTNEDYMEHTITSDSGELDSGYLRNDKIYDHVFNNIGTFEYYCSLHPSMTGKVIVE